MNRPDLSEARKRVCIWGDMCPDDDDCDCEACPYFTPCADGQATEQYEDDKATEYWLQWLRDWRECFEEEND